MVLIKTLWISSRLYEFYKVKLFFIFVELMKDAMPAWLTEIWFGLLL